jgi:hypothetical protein
MIIHCKNGVQVDTNPYIDFEERRVLVGNKWIRIFELPRIDNEYRLYYLNFGSFIYLITRDSYQDIERCYIIEQKLEKGHIKVENVYTSVEVGNCNALHSFFKYNKEFERNNLTDYLSRIIDVSLGYIYDCETLVEQIVDRLDGNNERIEPVEVPPTTPVAGEKSLSELARELKIPYNTLWNRVHRKGMSVEAAIALGKGKRGGYRGGKK